MGPLRAYSRPSHGAATGEFVTSPSPYGHTRDYSSQHRTFCLPLDTQHHHHHHHHLVYNSVCASDTLRVGLPSPSATTLQPGIFRIKKLLPPGEASTDPHPTSLSSRQEDGEGTEHDRWETGVQEEEEEQQDLDEKEWGVARGGGGQSGRYDVQWNVGDVEYRWKKDKDIQKWKRSSGQQQQQQKQQQCSESDHNTKCRRRVGQCKRKIEESGIWEAERDADDDHPWKKSRNSYKAKENSPSRHKIITSDGSGVQCTKVGGYNDHSCPVDNKNNSDWQRKEFVSPKLSPPPPPPAATGTDEACSSRMALVFPFSDDEDDGEDKERGTGYGGEHEAWPISDIVETEDEEGGHEETRGCSLIISGEEVNGGDGVGAGRCDGEEDVVRGGSVGVGGGEDCGGGEGDDYQCVSVGDSDDDDDDDDGGCDREEEEEEEDSDEGYGDDNDDGESSVVGGCGEGGGCQLTVRRRRRRRRELGRSSEPDQVNIVITQGVEESGCVLNGGDGAGGGHGGKDKCHDRGDSQQTADAQEDGTTGNNNNHRHHHQPEPLLLQSSSSSLPPGHAADALQRAREDHTTTTTPDDDDDDKNNNNGGVDEGRRRRMRRGGEGEGEEEDSPRDSGVRATQRLRPRSYRQFLQTRERRSRVFLKARSYQLGRWFVTHFTHPYPSKAQKDELANRTSMTRSQVSEWFGNMRRRIREATRGLGVCWEQRVRLYNSVITGKSEPLPIQPGDAINTWVPPVAEESSSLDQPEVSVSPKFKTTLMQRYLSDSFEGPAGDTQAPSHAASPSLEDSPLRHHHHRQQKEGISAYQRHHCHQGGSICVHKQENLDCFHQQQRSAIHHQHENSPCSYSQQQQQQDASTPTDCSAVLSRPLPLSTPSPKERIHALWNSCFENVKDPAGVLTGGGHRGGGKVHSAGIRGRGGDEGNKAPRKYERNTNQYNNNNNNNNIVAGSKRQRTEGNNREGSQSYPSPPPALQPQQSSSSTSLLKRVLGVGRGEWRGGGVSSTNSNGRMSSSGGGGLSGNLVHLPSPWTSRTSYTFARTTSSRFSDEGGSSSSSSSNRPPVYRQPEEIAAAYTLMQLQHM